MFGLLPCSGKSNNKNLLGLVEIIARDYVMYINFLVGFASINHLDGVNNALILCEHNLRVGELSCPK